MQIEVKLSEKVKVSDVSYIYIMKLICFTHCLFVLLVSSSHDDSNGWWR